MQSNWDKSFRLLLQSEGGFSNLSQDPGGMTNLGVTKSTWENWIGRGSDEAEMRSLTPQKVEPLYKKKYWDAVRGDELDEGIAYILFDFAVNAGVGRSIKTLQTCLGVPADGGFGPITMAAVKSVDPLELIKRFTHAKEEFYRSLPTFEVFGEGWLNRLTDVQHNANSMVK
jgi:lysozyme family protein